MRLHITYLDFRSIFVCAWPRYKDPLVSPASDNSCQLHLLLITSQKAYLEVNRRNRMLPTAYVPL